MNKQDLLNHLQLLQNHIEILRYQVQNEKIASSDDICESSIPVYSIVNQLVPNQNTIEKSQIKRNGMIRFIG
jgi:hypothetical protein